MQHNEWQSCPDCAGYGYTRTKGLPEQDWPQCPTCKGKGEVQPDKRETGISEWVANDLDYHSEAES